MFHSTIKHPFPLTTVTLQVRVHYSWEDYYSTLLDSGHFRNLIAIEARTDGHKFFKWVTDLGTQEENKMFSVQVVSDRDLE